MILLNLYNFLYIKGFGLLSPFLLKVVSYHYHNNQPNFPAVRRDTSVHAITWKYSSWEYHAVTTLLPSIKPEYIFIRIFCQKPEGPRIPVYYLSKTPQFLYWVNKYYGKSKYLCWGSCPQKDKQFHIFLYLVFSFLMICVITAILNL